MIHSLIKHYLSFVCLIAILIPFFGQSVAALSDSQRDALSSGVYYFDTSISTDCSTDVSVNLSGNDNAEKAFNYFVSLGLTASQAAAILGNFQQESGINPKRVQSDGESDKVPLDGKTGYGLAQWTDIGRQRNLDKFAKSQGRPVYTLDLQLDFAWKEASDGRNIEALKTTRTTEAATEYWMKSYERPADQGPAALRKRLNFAKAFLAKFGGGGGTVVTTPADNGDCSSATGPGQDTQYVEGFTVYSQYDRSWVNAPYSTSTVGASGCGPSAMAMIITALTGRQVTPDITAKYAASQNLYIRGVGSKFSIAPVLAKHWGLKARQIGKDTAKITASLQSGGLVITSGQGPLPFTTGGHYIVIRGVTSDGKWKVGDSGHNNTSDKEWNPQQLLDSMNDGSVYAITK